jgi:hypothetical protein
MRTLCWVFVPLGPVAAPGAMARDARTVAVKAVRTADGPWRLGVTVRSGDTGWPKHADRWKILGPGFRIPPGLHRVTVRADDKLNASGGKVVTVTLH